MQYQEPAVMALTVLVVSAVVAVSVVTATPVNWKHPKGTRQKGTGREVKF